MKPASRGARRSRTNALHWIGAAVVVGYVLWCWSDFSGPFRWLVDLQVRLTGRFYWEPLAVALHIGWLTVTGPLFFGPMGEVFAGW